MGGEGESRRGGMAIRGSAGLALVALALAACLAEPGAAGIGVEAMTHERTAEAGGRYEGSVTLKNSAAAPRSAVIYQRDYSFLCDGTNLYGEPGTRERSNADWITCGASVIEIPAGGRVSLPFVVDVPDDPGLVGTYWSLLMVEELPGDSGAGDLRAENGVMKQVIRYAIQCVTHVGGGTRDVAFLGQSLRVSDNGLRVLEVDVENVGERLLRPHLWAELYDSTGTFVGRFSSSERRIYPETSARYNIDVSRVPEGQYKALVVVEDGDEYVCAARYSLDF